MKIISWLKENKMQKIIFWFFIYTITTFLIGILCKFLVAWHVNDMHSQLQKTYDLFHVSASMPGSELLITLPTSQKQISLGDIFALDYLSKHKNDISAGDGDPDRFAIFKNHLIPFAAQFSDLETLVQTLSPSGSSTNFLSNVTQSQITQAISLLPNLEKDLEAVVGFQSDVLADAKYATSMAKEANLVFWLQIILIVLTLAAYPYGIFKLIQLKHSSKYQYTASMHKRLVVEYILFLTFFVSIDAYATYLLIAENVPMTFWNAFSVGSMAIPTGFAVGSLVFLHFNKKSVVNPAELQWKLKNIFHHVIGKK